MRKLNFLYKTKRRLVITIAVVVVLIILGFWIFGSSKQSVVKIPAVPVKLVKAKYMNLPITATAMGELVAPQNITLRAQQAGAVTKILVKDGQQVKQGQLLLTTQDATQQAAVAKAQSAYWQAKQQYDRYQQLVHQSQTLVSKSQYDQIVSTYQQALADLQAAQQNVSETHIVAPFPGRVGVIPVALGSYVQVGGNLLPLVNRQNIQVQYQLPETEFALVQLGQPVTVHTPSYPGQTFHAVVDYVAPSVSQVTRAFVVRAKVNNSKDLLSPGMLVQVEQTLVADKKVLVIPAVALVPTIDGMTVYRIKHNKVYSQRVKVARQHQQWAIIQQGLKEGDDLIASGDTKAHLGTTVKVVNK